MKRDIVKRLLKIANELDAAGFHKEAAELDEAVMEISPEELAEPAKEVDGPPDTDPAHPAAELGSAIKKERESRPASLAMLPAVAAKYDALKKQFGTVAVGSSVGTAGALAKAKEELAKLAPKKVPAKTETVDEDGLIHVLLAV